MPDVSAPDVASTLETGPLLQATFNEPVVIGTEVKYTFPGGPAYSGKNFARLKVTGP